MIAYPILTKINNNNNKKKKKKKKLLLLLCFYEFSNALITDASVSFPTLFIRSLGVVHRSSAKSHRLFFPVFILRILLDLGLDDFPAFEPVHIIAPIGATFLRQMAAQLKASSKRPRVKSSTGDASRAPPSSDPAVDEFIDPTAAVAPPPSALNVFSIRHTLDTVMTIQAAHGQLLVDVLIELQALHADLASFRRSPPPPSFDDE